MSKLSKQNQQRCALGALLLAAACAIFFTRLGAYPLFNPDEALYAEPAREMLETHNYLTSTLNYQTRFTKPPLSIWMEALTFKALGVNEFSARLFSALCAVVLVMAVFVFLTPYTGSAAAFLGASSLLSAPMFVAVGRMSITDMPLSLFVSGSLLCLFAAFREKKKLLLYTAYVLMGLAVMTKGPVGVVLPVVTVLAYHLLRKDLKAALSFYKLWKGLAVVAAIALPWFIAEIAVTHGEYFKAFIVRENFQRFTQIVDSHRGTWWYHLAALSAGFFPWTIFIPQILWRAFAGNATTSSSSRATACAAAAVKPRATAGGATDRSTAPAARELLLFSALTICCVIVFFSLSASKLLPYSLPAFPALACLLALELDYILEQQAWRRLAAPLAVLVVGLSAAGLAAPKFFYNLKHIPYALLSDINACIAFEVLIMTASLVLLLLRKTKTIAVAFLFLSQLLAFAYFGSNVLAKVSNLWEKPIPVLSRMAACSGEPIFVYRMRKVSVLFYAGRATVLSPNQEFLTTTVEQELPKYPRACIIARASDLKYFSNDRRFRLIKCLGNYVLIEWMR